MEIIEVIHQLISEFPNMHGTVLIAQGKEVLYHEGFSYRDAPFPTDKNAQHLIASVTKQFTAAALLKALLDKNFKQNPLQEDDQTLKTAVIHDLRKPLAAFLPPEHSRWDGSMPEWANQVTLHHLLTHTSGIKNVAEALEFPPSQRYAYSNVGYFLLGARNPRYKDLSVGFDWCGILRKAYFRDAQKNALMYKQ